MPARIKGHRQKKIEDYLREGKLTQSLIARLVGVHRSTVSRVKKKMALKGVNWGEKVRLVLAGFLHLGISIPTVAENCSISLRALHELWRQSDRNAFERTYQFLVYAATRIFGENELSPDFQLARLEKIGFTIRRAMGKTSWSVAAKRTVWILEHRT